MTDFAKLFSFIDCLAWATFFFCFSRLVDGIIGLAMYNGPSQQKSHMARCIRQSPVLFRYGIGLVLSIGWIFVK